MSNEHSCSDRGLYCSLDTGGGGGGSANAETQQDTSRSTGRSGRQNAATRRNMRREERVTVQGPVKKQLPLSAPSVPPTVL